MREEVAAQLNPDRWRVTGSEMRTWQRCHRKWYLGYYLRWGKRAPDFGKPTAVGTIVHNALQTIYDPEKQNVDVIAEMDAARAADHERFPSYQADIEKDHDLARIMVQGYMDWLEEEGHDAHLKLKESERGLETNLPPYDPDEITLLGKLDGRVVDELEQSRWALEHKTVGDLKTPLGLLQIDFQLLTEHLLEFLDLMEEGADPEEADVRRAGGVLYNMLRKVKRTAASNPPYYKREPVRHNIEELRNHWAHVYGIVEEMRTAKAKLDNGMDHQSVVFPHPTKDCKWDCPFFAVCPLMDDGSDYQGLLNDQYEQVDPLERYNRDLKESMKGDSVV